MASIPCTIQLATSTSSRRTSPRVPPQGTALLGRGAARRTQGWLRLGEAAPARESGRVRFFKFGNKDAEGAGIYGSQARDDFDRDDVEQYFNYMGMLAVEGTYDKMEALLSQGTHPVDILLLLAASEGDVPKIEELLRAGAKCDVKDPDERTALDRATSEEVRDLIAGFAPANKA
ncbi:protein LHCP TRANSLOCATION DEFECT [Brachypodium distachyon]|nr:protein LHCP TRANSLOCATION DEFECT [Brachypodium distachyon]PNT75000.1 hypothetical protein BRADI_1g26070v3 [Brachypodium distachyon]PNT75001.1 hypothetical protein BRADI_1g26070v3 [Brachypodium distachyon]|eukprot:XP_003560142.1 protein LHCP TRANSLOCATION DEFECT [Brachypodium distachyon]